MLPEGSHETVRSELQIFDRPEYQVSHLKGAWIEYTPIASCAGTEIASPIQFDIPKAEGLYTDLANSYVAVTVSILLDNAALTAGATATKVALNNLALATLF